MHWTYACNATYICNTEDNEVERGQCARSIRNKAQRGGSSKMLAMVCTWIVTSRWCASL